MANWLPWPGPLLAPVGAVVTLLDALHGASLLTALADGAAPLATYTAIVAIIKHHTRTHHGR